MKYKIITRDDYKKNKDYYIKLIDELFTNDSSKIANITEFINHLEFIFSNNQNNDSILILNIENNKLISMVNFLEYNNIEKLWCLFSLFTLKSKRNLGYGQEILKYGINQVKNRGAKGLISGIEPTNLQSIRLHEKLGFKNSGKMWNEIAEGFPENHIAYILKF